MSSPFYPVLRDTVGGLIADDIVGETAKVAFFMVLSLFPLLVVTLMLTGVVGGARAFEVIVRVLQGMVPPDGAAFLRQYIEDIAREQRPEALSLGLFVTLFVASFAIFQLEQALNLMYGLQGRSSWIGRRFMAVGVMLVSTLILLAGLSLLLVGPTVLGWIGLATIAEIVRWPLGLLLIVLVMAIVYRVLPNRRGVANWRGIAIGAAVGALLLGVVTVGFRVYLAGFADLDVMYGALGGPIALMLWLYLMTMALLIGAKLAAVIEQHEGAAVAPAKAPQR